MNNYLLFLFLILQVIIGFLIIFDFQSICRSKKIRVCNEYTDVVISLTSCPKRLNDTETTLTSLLNGSLLPKSIIFNIPYVSLKGEEYIIPDWLLTMCKQYPIITINRCEDYGPATKIIPTLIKYKDVPDQKIIYLDNDQIYPIHFIRDFLNDYKDENAVLARAGWNVEFYEKYVCNSKLTQYLLKFKYNFPIILILLSLIFFGLKGMLITSNIVVALLIVLILFSITKKCNRDIVSGCKGVLVKPKFFILDKLLEINNYPNEVKFHDDIFLSGHLNENGIKRVVKSRKIAFPVIASSHFKYALRNTNNAEEVNRCIGIQTFNNW